MRFAPIVVLLVTAACTNGNDKKAGTPAPAPETTTATTERAKGPAATPPKAPAGPQITEFAAVSIEGLPDTERQTFVQIVNDEICPCDCPKSWAACLQKDTKCRPAVILAEWLIGELAEGVPGDVLAEQLTNEIGAFTGMPKKPTTTGYATKGAKSGKHTIVEFADFECAHCKMAAPVMKTLVQKRPDVTFVYKHFPLSLHPNAVPAAEAAEAAGAQGKFWEMHDAIFATQNMLDDALFEGHAKALGLDVKKWQAARASFPIKDRVAQSRKEGEALGVEATPTFFINGREFNLMRTEAAFETRLKMEDARASSSCR